MSDALRITRLRIKAKSYFLEMHVVGFDMECPLCHEMVSSGTRHECSYPKTEDRSRKP